MKKAKVYFADFRTTLTENRLQKLQRLMRAAGVEKIDFKGAHYRRDIGKRAMNAGKDN